MIKEYRNKENGMAKKTVNEQETEIEAFDIDAALLRMEEINNRLSEKNIPLNESIKLYTEGSELAQKCQEHLQGVEKQLKIING